MKRVGLTAKRVAMGLAQVDLAVRVHVDESTIYRWEAGTSTPRPIQRRRLADALDVTLDEVDALLSAETPPAEAAMGRRTVLAGIGSSLAARTLPPMRPHQVSPELATYFGDQLRAHYRADMLLGPHLLIDTVTAQYAALCH